MRWRLRSLRRPAHTRSRDCAAGTARHAPLSGAPGRQEHRLYRGGGSRPLAQAGGGGRSERRQGHLLREADVTQPGRRRCHGGGGEADPPGRANRLAARQLPDLREGQRTAFCRNARRADARRGMARPTRSHRCLGVSASAGLVSPESGLGYGAGDAGDLLVHLISGMMFMLGINEPPRQASAVGGIRRWKDGRNMPDVQAVLYYYGELPVYMRLNLGTEMPETYRLQGSKGILEVSESGLSYTPQSGKDSAPSYYANSFPRALREAYIEQWHRENDPKMGQVPMAEAISFRGPDYDDVNPHLWTFFEAVRSQKHVVEDAVFGHHAALACHMANESYFRKSAVSWDDASKTIGS